ncbi:MAG: hypothetical protein IAG13_31310, partial [Deltaproteobacteria bacterium]|nr:hypothetical protein [Nannocystaceae bacterium]
FVALALALHSRARRWTMLLAFAAGIAAALAPMALRNLEVTDTATVFPAHGGGTSFYIGNNAKARGVWNPAGVFTGDVTHERDELGRTPANGEAEGVRVAAMGRELYERAWADIAEDPARWIWLECRKLWLLLGNDELAQDFDVYGERELIPWAYPFGVPFGLVLALAIVGAHAWWRERASDPLMRGRLLVLGGLALASIAANIVFFTSSQHRVPLVIPLVVLAGVGLQRLLAHGRDRTWLRAHRVVLAIAMLIAAQAMWPRSRTHSPSAAHYLNLALAYDRVSELRPALGAADKAVAIAPDHPVIRMERASFRRQIGDLDGAKADLEHLATLPTPPAWVLHRAASEAQSIATTEATRELAAPRK